MLLWSDVSEYQVHVNDQYPHPVLCIRSNDGTYRDKKFAGNYAWACRALDTGQLTALIIYMVYRPNWQETLDTTRTMVGTPHPRTAFMIDVESWGGQITGDHSARINQLFRGLASWAGSPTRVIGYGNMGDLTTMWPVKPPGIRLIVAAYGTTPSYPGMLGHQFTDGTTHRVAVPPFGFADVNTAEGHGTASFCAALGIGGTTTRGDRSMIVQLPRTPTPSDPKAPPSGWPVTEEVVQLGAVGGWGGRCVLRFAVGHPGGYLYRAHIDYPQGTGKPPRIVPWVDAAAGQSHDLLPAYKADTDYSFEPTPGTCTLMITYAAPGGASLSVEYEK